MLTGLKILDGIGAFRANAFMAFHFRYGIAKNAIRLFWQPLNNLPIDPQETPYQGNCPECKSTDITPDTDVMDTWNTSSLTPYICYALYNPRTSNHCLIENVHKDEFIPMSMRPQAHDIIRTWAFYTIVKAWMHNKNSMENYCNFRPCA